LAEQHRREARGRGALSTGEGEPEGGSHPAGDGDDVLALVQRVEGAQRPGRFVSIRQFPSSLGLAAAHGGGAILEARPLRQVAVPGQPFEDRRNRSYRSFVRRPRREASFQP
jgi:hypothetical protein